MDKASISELNMWAVKSHCLGANTLPPSYHPRIPGEITEILVSQFPQGSINGIQLKELLLH
jgi:hypothetical protein